MTSLCPKVYVLNLYLAIDGNGEESLTVTVSLQSATKSEPWLCEIKLNCVFPVREREIITEFVASEAECLEEIPVLCAVDRFCYAALGSTHAIP